MDLISIERKYRNTRNIIVFLLFVVICTIITLAFFEIKKHIVLDELYNSFNKQGKILEEKAIEVEKMRLEKEREMRLPKFTEEAQNNMANLYHSENKRVFLTFDDGPSQTVTIPILDLLKKENIKATFFVLGNRAKLNPEILKREYAEGHFIASHGYSHVYSQIYETPQSVLDEYNKSVEAIRNAIGEPTYNPHLFRFPGGYFGGKYASIKQEALQILEQNEIFHVDWNALTADAAGNSTTEQFIAEIDKTAVKHNSVVLLMHDAGTKTATAEALPEIIKYFRDRNYEFKNFYDIFN